MSPRPTSFAAKLFFSLGFIAVSVAYALWQTLGGHSVPDTQTSVTPPSTVVVTSVPSRPKTTPPPSVRGDDDGGEDGGTSTVPTPAPTPTPTPVVVAPPPAPAPKPKGQYVDGSYTGSVVDAYYGNVQVKAIISGGKLTDVQFLQYPNDRGTSVAINRQAMPQLTQEAIQAQSAQVDGVSGASDTSAAFVQSLSAALAAAKA